MDFSDFLLCRDKLSLITVDLQSTIVIRTVYALKNTGLCWELRSIKLAQQNDFWAFPRLPKMSYHPMSSSTLSLQHPSAPSAKEHTGNGMIFLLLTILFFIHTHTGFRPHLTCTHRWKAARSRAAVVYYKDRINHSYLCAPTLCVCVLIHPYLIQTLNYKLICLPICFSPNFKLL